jgi:adenosylcobinamide-phosphate synthase
VGTVSAGRRRAAALVVGFALDALVGDPARGHPVAGFGRLAAGLEQRLWRPRRDVGVAYVALLLTGAGLLSARAGRGLCGASTVIWTTLGGRSLARAALRMDELLRAGSISDARAQAPVLVGRDPRSLVAAELARATVESVAENTADAVVGPLLWGALAGVPGAAVYRAANTLDAMVGHRSPRYLRFGWASARLDDLLTWPAARLGAIIAVLVSPLAGADGRAALRILRRDGARHPSPNAGLMEASFAGALGLRLGGNNDYGTHVETRPALGDGRPPGADDIARAVLLSRLVGVASVIACLLLTGRTLVVDESFMDFVAGDGWSLADRRDVPGVVVLRSLTKAWSLAGLRAGYLLGPPDVVERLAAHRQPWSVSTAALAAMTECLADREAPARLAAEVSACRRDLCERLARIPGVTLWPSAANFVLVEVPGRGPAIVDSLASAGIAVRPCASFPGLGEDHIRLAVRSPEEHEVLAGAIALALPANAPMHRGAVPGAPSTAGPRAPVETHA